MLQNIKNFIINANNSNFLSDEKILKLNLLINNIKLNTNIDLKIELPVIITIGSQSSSKSTVLNRIMGIELLPTGNKLTTRVPLILNCINI